MFALLYFSFSLIALVIASYTDIRQRIVSDKITLGLIVFGLALHGIESWTIGNYSPLVLSAAVCAAAFIGGFVLWKLGVWAGGDVKIFTGIGAMNPINPNAIGAITGIALFNATALPVFPLSLFIFSVFAMMPYGILLSIAALKKKKEKRKAIINSIKGGALRLAELSVATIGFTELLSKMNLNLLLVLPALVILGIVPKSIRILAIVLVAFFAVAQQQLVFVFDSVALFAVLFAAFAIIKLALESRGLLNSRKKITELKDGDIVGETITEHKGKIGRYSGIKIGKVINYLKANNLEAVKKQFAPEGKIVCSHRSAGGVTEQEIKELGKLVAKGLLEDSIEIKQSAAFVPAILIAFILLNIIGDLLWNIILR